jgi:hypothetical protein
MQITSTTQKLIQLLPTCVNLPEAKEGSASVLHQCSCITLQTNSEPTKKFMQPRRDSLNCARWIMRPQNVAESVNADQRERQMIQRPPKRINSHVSPKKRVQIHPPVTRVWSSTKKTTEAPARPSAFRFPWSLGLVTGRSSRLSRCLSRCLSLSRSLASSPRVCTFHCFLRDWLLWCFFCFRKEEEEQRCPFFGCFVFSWFLLRHSSLILCVYEFVKDPPPGLVSQSNFFCW